MNNNVPKLVLVISFYLISPFFILSLTAQNWQQMIIAVATDRSNNGGFGYSVAISGDYAVIAARGDGSAYIFKRNGATWLQEAKIVAADRATNDLFGYSVAISGDYACVSAPEDDDGTGSAYIFKREGTTWIQQAKIVAADRFSNDGFGYSVAFSGDYLVVGAYREEDGVLTNLVNSGSAYIFKREGTTWIQQAKIVAADRAEADFFGFSVAISGDYVIAGAWSKNLEVQGGNTIEYAGCAYIFKRNGTTWIQEAKLVASDRATNDWFGYSVAISGDYAVIAARGDRSAYIFKRNGTTWIQEAKLVASDRATNDWFGYSVAISGDYAIAGAAGENVIVTGGVDIEAAGSAYIFKRNGTTWIQETKLVSSNRAIHDYFGYSVAIENNYALVGNIGDDVQFENSGSVYFYQRSLIVPVELTDFKGRNTEGGNLLTWTTVSEINSHHFDIERSTDGQRWSKLGFVGAKNKPSEYQYVDQTPKLNEVNYYRLCTVDIDGKKEFSKIVSIKMNEVRSSIKIYPSITEGVIQIETTLDIKKVWITNAFGQIVLSSRDRLLNLGSFPSGIYLVTVQGDNSIFSEKVFKK